MFSTQRLQSSLENTKYNANEHDHISLDMVTNKKQCILYTAVHETTKQAKKVVIFGLTAMKHVTYMKLLMLRRK